MFMRNMRHFLEVLRATAVPPGNAEARISYGDYVCLYVCLSVRHDPVAYQAQAR